MATKVKGEAIKEGSIPMSALSTEVKNKIENAGAGGGGADWNAQEGEAGYIENKPFRIIKSKNGQLTNINSYFIMTEDEYTPTNNLFIKYNNKISLLAKEKLELYYSEGAVAYVDNITFYLTDDGDSNIIINNAHSYEFELVIALSSEFIPDTLIKTTPQTLTNNDKNQALANLGINGIALKTLISIHVIDNLSFDPDTNINNEPISQDLLDLVREDPLYAINRIAYSDDGSSTVTICNSIEYLINNNDIICLHFDKHVAYLNIANGFIKNNPQ